MNECTDLRKKSIKDMAEEIREYLVDSNLYKTPIDMDNINHLLVGAYYCGRYMKLDEAKMIHRISMFYT